MLRARLRSFWRSIVHRSKVEHELSSELQFHLEARAADLVTRHGLAREEATRRARVEFGSLEKCREEARASLGLRLVDECRLDLRYAWRSLCKSPSFTAVTVLTLTLGIGATTLLFSVADGVLLKPLPWSDAAQLVRVTEMRQGRMGRVPGTVSNGTYLAWRDQLTTVEDLGGWLRTDSVTLTGAGDAVRMPIVPVTPSLFQILRVHPLIGRLFVEEEGAGNQPGGVILSYAVWRERFNERADIVGHVVQLNERPYTIVGVMPREFAFPDSETRAWTAWRVPSVMATNGALSGVIFRAMARLRPEATPEQAAAEATSRAQTAPDLGLAARALFGAEGPIDVSVVPELQAITSDVKPAILMLLAGVALLLVTSTANVASLQLVRATVRRRELAVRAAIGAGRRRIVGQLLVENGIVGLCGACGGLLLAAGLHRVLPWLVPEGFPRLDAVALDLRALLFALFVAMLASVACGLLPAWHTRRLNLGETLLEDGVASISGKRSPAARTRTLIMVGQVAIACLLLVGASLLTRSFSAMVHADRGYDPVNILTARLPLPPGFSGERRRQLMEMLVDRLRAQPGVTHAAYSNGLPFVAPGGAVAFNMRSPRDPALEIEVQATQHLVSPSYFGALRLRLVEGRTLSDADTSATPPVVVVNRTFARQYLGDHAIGVRIPQRGPGAGRVRAADVNAEWVVVGVVEDMRPDRLDASLQPAIYASLNQIEPSSVRNFDPILLIRTTADPTTYVSTLRSLVHEEAPALALDSVMTMEDRVMTSLETPRLYAVVLAWFSMVALLVAAIGLFGVLSFSVAQRAREIGVRSALGAQPSDIIALVLRQALWIVSIGVLVGLGAAVAGVRLLSAFLYGISPHDAVTFVVVPIVIATTAAIACVVPARRASRVDPMVALRCE